MVSASRQTFDRGVTLSHRIRDCDLARAHGVPIFMDRAGSANAHPASVFGPGQLQQVTQHPEQRHIRFGLDLLTSTVDLKRVLRHGGAIDGLNKERLEAVSQLAFFGDEAHEWLLSLVVYFDPILCWSR